MGEKLSLGQCVRLKMAGYPQSDKGAGYCWSNSRGSYDWRFENTQDDLHGYNDGARWISHPTKDEIENAIFEHVNQNFTEVKVSVSIQKQIIGDPMISASVDGKLDGTDFSESFEAPTSIEALTVLYIHIVEFDYAGYVKTMGWHTAKKPAQEGTSDE